MGYDKLFLTGREGSRPEGVKMKYTIRNRRTGDLVYGEFATKWDAAKYLILNHGTSYDRRYRIEVSA